MQKKDVSGRPAGQRKDDHEIPHKKTNKSKARPVAGEQTEPESSEKKGGILVEAAENLEAGARIISDKAVETAGKVAGQTTRLASSVYQKIKDGVYDAYDVSAKTVDDLGKTAQYYVAQFEDTLEMRSLNEKKNVLLKELGVNMYKSSAKKSQTADQLLGTKASLDLIDKINKINKDIIRLGKQQAKKK